MAKMFYNLEEAAQRLGMDRDSVVELAKSGQLQQFRDREELKFKRDQVDKLAEQGAEAPDSAQTKAGAPASPNEESGELKLADPDESQETLDDDSSAESHPGDTDTIDAINLADEDISSGDENADPGGSRSGSATGISIFDADEVDSADPAAQTQQSGAAPSEEKEEEDLTLETVGSGSGLLDLTRESDETSLGAVDLLEGMSSGEATGTGAATSQDTGPSVTGVGQAISGESDIFGQEQTPEESGASGWRDLESSHEPAPQQQQQTAAAQQTAADPAWDGFEGGMLIGVMCVIIVGLLVVVTGMQGMIIKLTSALSSNLLAYFVAIAVGCLVFGGIGYMIGNKVVAKS